MMRADDFLRQVTNVPMGTLADLTDGRPDDETLGAGGLIAAACERGQRVEVVLLTDGSGSHPNSRAYPRDRLVALRKNEIEQAGLALGLPAGRLTCLDLTDAHAPTSGPLFDGAVARIGEIVAATGATTVFVTWRHDPHCDHEAAAQMALALRHQNPALKLWSYPIWGWHLAPETLIDAPPPEGVRFDISPWIDRKHAAIAAHRSQMTDLIDDDPEGFHFTPVTLAPFLRSYEFFVEVPA